MFCKECGAQINDKAMICPKCGVPVAAAKPTVTSNEKVSSHMVEAILVTLFCCLPFGIVSIIYASKVNARLAMGDVEGAKAASRSANRWLLTGAGLAGVLTLLYMALCALGVMSEEMLAL